MKFVFALVSLASVAAVNAAPGVFFQENGPLGPLEKIQISNRKIQLAGVDMDVTEKKLQALALKEKEIEDAAKLVTAAADKKVYTGTFEHEAVVKKLGKAGSECELASGKKGKVVVEVDEDMIEVKICE